MRERFLLWLIAGLSIVLMLLSRRADVGALEAADTLSWSRVTVLSERVDSLEVRIERLEAAHGRETR